MSPTTSSATLRWPATDPLSADELIERAVTSGDAHAIKLTEAALRCYARTDEPALLLAAADASARLGRLRHRRPGGAPTG